MPVWDLDDHLKHERGVKSVIAPFSDQVSARLPPMLPHLFAVAAVTQKAFRLHAIFDIYLISIVPQSQIDISPVCNTTCCS